VGVGRIVSRVIPVVVVPAFMHVLVNREQFSVRKAIRRPLELSKPNHFGFVDVL